MQTIPTCEACQGLGWRLMDNATHGLRVERCDACERYADDVDAYGPAHAVLKHAIRAATPKMIEPPDDDFQVQFLVTLQASIDQYIDEAAVRSSMLVALEECVRNGENRGFNYNDYDGAIEGIGVVEVIDCTK